MSYLTLDDLAKRWGITYEAVKVRRHRGLLPPPDRTIGRSPVWTEQTIKTLEGNHDTTDSPTR